MQFISSVTLVVFYMSIIRFRWAIEFWIHTAKMVKSKDQIISTFGNRKVYGRICFGFKFCCPFFLGTIFSTLYFSSVVLKIKFVGCSLPTSLQILVLSSKWKQWWHVVLCGKWQKRQYFIVFISTHIVYSNYMYERSLYNSVSKECLRIENDHSVKSGMKPE